MIRRSSIALLGVAIVFAANGARAQGTSLSVGAAIPSGDLSKTAGTGIEVSFQVRTDPMIGPLALRIDVTYARFPGTNGASILNFSSQSIGVAGDFGSMFYWTAGPGYYQSNTKQQLLGHTVVDQRSYLAVQGAVGMNIRIIRWNAFLEAGAAKMLGTAENRIYMPVRFGFRL